MNERQSGQLGFSANPPASIQQQEGPETGESAISGPGYPLPLWIQFPANPAGLSHLNNCTAWWLITTKDKESLAVFMARRPGKTHLTTRIDNCRAWIWLQRFSADQIRAALANLPEAESLPLRLALNTVRHIIRNHTEGKTYD